MLIDQKQLTGQEMRRLVLSHVQKKAAIAQSRCRLQLESVF